MCSHICPCYHDEDGHAYDSFDRLPDEYLSRFNRKFFDRESGDKRVPFKWSKEREGSYESFAECLTYWRFIDHMGSK